jgi:hypothetical protein
MLSGRRFGWSELDRVRSVGLASSPAGLSVPQPATAFGRGAVRCHWREPMENKPTAMSAPPLRRLRFPRTGSLELRTHQQTVADAYKRGHAVFPCEVVETR